ncbi:C39 family peptidase [Elusimicrobiota bacterium]
MKTKKSLFGIYLFLIFALMLFQAKKSSAVVFNLPNNIKTINVSIGADADISGRHVSRDGAELIPPDCFPSGKVGFEVIAPGGCDLALTQTEDNPVTSYGGGGLFGNSWQERIVSGGCGDLSITAYRRISTIRAGMFSKNTRDLVNLTYNFAYTDTALEGDHIINMTVGGSAGSCYDYPNVFGYPDGYPQLTYTYDDGSGNIVTEGPLAIAPWATPATNISVTLRFPEAASKYDLAISAGGGQEAVIIQSLENPLKVIVKEGENPKDDLDIAFSITQDPSNGKASFSETEILREVTIPTGPDGISQTLFKLGNKIGSYKVTASCAGDAQCEPQSVTFSVNALPAYLDRESPNDDPNLEAIIHTVSQPLDLAVKTQESSATANVIADVEINWSGEGPAPFSFPQQTLFTDTNGLSKITTLLIKPLNYLFTASSFDAEPSEEEFRVCGKLNINNWKQYEGGWENGVYDNTTLRIRASGCLLTAYAQILQYLGIDTDPAQLNTWLIGDNGFNPGGRIRPISMRNYSMTFDQSVLFETERAFSEELIDNELSSGKPVIAFLYSISSSPYSVAASSGSHFIVITGKCKDTYLVNDPGHGTWRIKTLDDYISELRRNYANPLFWRVRNVRTVNQLPDDFSYIGTSGRSPVHLLLTDPLGRKVGYNPSAPPYGWAMWDHYHEMPNSAYEPEGGLPVDPNDPHNRPPVVRELKIGPVEIRGDYKLEVVGTGDGIYHIDMLLINKNGEILLDSTSLGLASSNTKDHFSFSYDPLSSQPVPIIKNVTLMTLQKDLNTAFNIGLIDNQGIYNSLKKKIGAAISAQWRGKAKVIRNILQSFINELEAQRNKHIKDEAYQVLKNDVEVLLGPS